MNLQADKDKFLSVIQQHKRIIYKICNSYCKDPEDRKDLSQEIIVQLWKSFSKYNDQYKISTWLYRIALNVAISFYRKSYKRQKNTSLNSENIFEIEDDSSEVEELESNIKLLYQFINQLNELNKALMILYLDDNSYKDIADILGITETNVATKISRIKQKLKKQFATV